MCSRHGTRPASGMSVSGDSMRCGIALDLGTSGFRCQAIDLGTHETLASSVTERHPIPGMNVIDHVNFAMKSGEATANRLMIEAVNNLLSSLHVDLGCVEVIAVCGNPFQLSLFQNIEIRDLAYAGKNMVRDLGVVSPERNGEVVKAGDLGIRGVPADTDVIIPPAVTHEIGADALAMMLMTDFLNQKEPCIVVDYGTNAEMALIYDGNIYTGSAAAGPALEGQQISQGMLAAPGALSAVEVEGDGWRCYVLDGSMAPVKGDLVDPLTGRVIEEGPMHGKAIGITGTGVVASLANGMAQGIIQIPKIDSPDGDLHLQDGIRITSGDVEEAGKAIGALRAGFLTLLDAAGIWVDDVRTAYMSGASGLYVDAYKAMQIGMVIPGATHIIQFGNTSISLARKIVLRELDLGTLRSFAKKLKATHCMFATSEFFKNLYSVEYSLWCSSMPFDQYNPMLEIYGIKPLPPVIPKERLTVDRHDVRDLPDTDGCVVSIVACGTVLGGVVEGCLACRKCVEECPENALSIIDRSGTMYAEIRSDRCAGTACRRCERVCPAKAMKTSGFVPIDRR